ncbi:hypothetical protein [Sphingomonas sp. CFBP 8760]|uniref:hypothetical protein n=1 Tax=Sphingomonas sp. CFBP 8760 TaxID=2775282 RepID=UPI00177A88FE|nr:hypothetical protein [Sphingomonas sp. CFBP 8760]MBD8549051.1 hypothetical protein [Sphingomonas sp. CFBP 8760]
MNRIIWNREKDVELARRYVAGEPVEQIAAEFGCTPGVITTRCGTLDLLRRKTRKTPVPHGNAPFLIGQALHAALPVDGDDFCKDLLNKLD